MWPWLCRLQSWTTSFALAAFASCELCEYSFPSGTVVYTTLGGTSFSLFRSLFLLFFFIAARVQQRPRLYTVVRCEGLTDVSFRPLDACRTVFLCRRLTEARWALTRTFLAGLESRGDDGYCCDDLTVGLIMNFPIGGSLAASSSFSSRCGNDL